MSTLFTTAKISNSAGVILSKVVPAQLNAEVGGALSPVVTPNGIELSPAEPALEAQMAVAREIMAQRKPALCDLAK